MSARLSLRSLSLTFFLSLGLPADAHRFLFINANAGLSHMMYTGKLADLLVDAGHEVDYVIPIFNHFIHSNGTKKANVTRLLLPSSDKLDELQRGMSWWNDVFESEINPREGIKFSKMFAMYCEDVLQNGALLNQLRERKYAAGFAETIDSCSFVVFHKLGIRVVHELSALPITEFSAFVHGVPMDNNHIPLSFNHEQTRPIDSLYARWHNWYLYLFSRFFLGRQSPTSAVLERLYGPDFPSAEELAARSSFVWLNVNPLIDFPRSLPPNIKQIGGVAVGKPKELDEKTAAVFARPSKGVILVSFGSVVDTARMSDRIRNSFLNAFAQFPDYEVLWKVTSVESGNLSELVAERYPNVHPMQWVDQTSILAHPKTVAFITHAGLNSLNEAALHSVPMVSVPFFADQMFNTGMLVGKKLGVFVDRRHLNADSLGAAIREVLNNPSYRKAAERIGRKMAALPFEPADVFVRLVEYSAVHGPFEEFRLPASKDAFWQQYSLDLLSIVLLLVFVLFLALISASRSVLRISSQLLAVLQRGAKKKSL